MPTHLHHRGGQKHHGVVPASSNWTCLVCDTVTGAVLDEVVITGTSYSRKINDSGSWSVEVPFLEMSATIQDQITTWITPWRFSWVLVFNDDCIQGGPVLHHQWADASQKLTVSGIGMQGVLAHRLLRSDVAEASIVSTDADITFTNVTLIQEAKLMIAQAMKGSGSRLPFRLPPDDVMGLNTDTFFGYDLAMAAERLDKLEKRSAGPDLDFSPYIDPDSGGTKVAWDVRIGAPLGSINSNALWDYPYSALAIDTDVDGSQMANRVWSVGSGNQRQLVAGYVTNPYLQVLGFPNLDFVTRNHTDEPDPIKVLDYAASYANLLQVPISTWKVIVRQDGSTASGEPADAPRVGSYFPGDTIRLNILDHAIIPDGEYIERVLGFQQGGRPGDVELLLQSTGGFV